MTVCSELYLYHDVTFNLSNFIAPLSESALHEATISHIVYLDISAAKLEFAKRMMREVDFEICKGKIIGSFTLVPGDLHKTTINKPAVPIMG